MGDLAAARALNGSPGVEGSPIEVDLRAYENLESLRAKFDAATEAFRESPSDKKKAAYKAAKTAYAQARVSVRIPEMEDPNNPRGIDLAIVSE